MKFKWKAIKMKRILQTIFIRVPIQERNVTVYKSNKVVFNTCVRTVIHAPIASKACHS